MRYPSITRRAIVAILLALSAAPVAFAQANPHADHASHAQVVELDEATASTSYDYFTNFGNYMARTHCMVRADGTPDWPWIITYIALNIGVLTGYLLIFRFWCKSYFAEAKIDRNSALMNLALIFLLCATTGYLFSIVMFFWPAYRLQAIFLAVLSVVTWVFATKAGGLRASFSAFRLERELQESLRQRADELEKLVAERTSEAETAKREAIKANEAKSRFVAHMSHEIRTPLSAMLGYTALLGEQENIDAEMRRDYVETVRNAGDHLLGIINDILDFSKMEAGKMELAVAPSNIRNVAAEVVRLFDVRAKEKGLSLQLDVESDVPEVLLFDAVRIKQILSNLVGNAVKYTDTGRVDVLVKYEFKQLVLQVRDTGPGISEDRCKDLFQPFVQVDGSMSRRHGGTGLGLTICRRFAERMGGTASVHSKVGRGSTFTVSIPASAAKGTPKSDQSVERALESNLLQGRTILIAEDHVRLRQLTAMCIEKAGAEVVAVTNGDEALAAVAGRHFDLILLDMQMPIRDGYATARQLRAEGVSAPIVAFTAHAFSSERDACIAAGCSHCLTKPFDPAQLASLLASFMTSTPEPEPA